MQLAIFPNNSSNNKTLTLLLFDDVADVDADDLHKNPGIQNVRH